MQLDLQNIVVRQQNIQANVRSPQLGYTVFLAATTTTTTTTPTGTHPIRGHQPLQQGAQVLLQVVIGHVYVALACAEAAAQLQASWACPQGVRSNTTPEYSGSKRTTQGWTDLSCCPQGAGRRRGGTQRSCG